MSLLAHSERLLVQSHNGQSHLSQTGGYSHLVNQFLQAHGERSSEGHQQMRQQLQFGNRQQGILQSYERKLPSLQKLPNQSQVNTGSPTRFPIGFQPNVSSPSISYSSIDIGEYNLQIQRGLHMFEILLGTKLRNMKMKVWGRIVVESKKRWERSLIAANGKTEAQNILSNYTNSLSSYKDYSRSCTNSSNNSSNNSSLRSSDHVVERKESNTQPSVTNNQLTTSRNHSLIGSLPTRSHQGIQLSSLVHSPSARSLHPTQSTPSPQSAFSKVQLNQPPMLSPSSPLSYEQEAERNRWHGRHVIYGPQMGIETPLIIGQSSSLSNSHGYLDSVISLNSRHLNGKMTKIKNNHSHQQMDIVFTTMSVLFNTRMRDYWWSLRKVIGFTSPTYQETLIVVDSNPNFLFESGIFLSENPSSIGLESEAMISVIHNDHHLSHDFAQTDENVAWSNMLQGINTHSNTKQSNQLPFSSQLIIDCQQNNSFSNGQSSSSRINNHDQKKYNNHTDQIIGHESKSTGKQFLKKWQTQNVEPKSILKQPMPSNGSSPKLFIHQAVAQPLTKSQEMQFEQLDWNQSQSIKQSSQSQLHRANHPKESFGSNFQTLMMDSNAIHQNKVVLDNINHHKKSDPSQGELQKGNKIENVKSPKYQQHKEVLETKMRPIQPSSIISNFVIIPKRSPIDIPQLQLREPSDDDDEDDIEIIPPKKFDHRTHLKTNKNLKKPFLQNNFKSPKKIKTQSSQDRKKINSQNAGAIILSPRNKKVREEQLISCNLKGRRDELNSKEKVQRSQSKRKVVTTNVNYKNIYPVEASSPIKLSGQPESGHKSHSKGKQQVFTRMANPTTLQTAGTSFTPRQIDLQYYAESGLIQIQLALGPGKSQKSISTRGRTQQQEDNSAANHRYSQTSTNGYRQSRQKQNSQKQTIKHQSNVSPTRRNHQQRLSPNYSKHGLNPRSVVQQKETPRLNIGSNSVNDQLGKKLPPRSPKFETKKDF